LVKQAFFLLALSLAAGALRQGGPRGLAWNGKWPTASTSAEDAYKMMAREGDPGFIDLSETIDVQQQNTATILDARSHDEFKAGHIPGAKSLPYYEINQYKDDALANLAADAPIIIYCEGIGCELSFFLGRDLVAGGFTNIRIFYGGYPEWSQAGLPIEKES
jgi:rhodanese-related sulfurtransferase